MKKFTFIFILWAFVYHSQNTQTLCPDGTPCVIYEVQKQESLYGISKKFNTTQDQILKYNPDIQKNGLKAGQKILIPQDSDANNKNKAVVTTNTAPVQVPETYTVKKGETFFSIQKQFKLTRQEILDMNPGLNPDNLQEGTIIRLKKLPEGTVKELMDKFKNNRNFQSESADVIQTVPSVPAFSFEPKNKYTVAVMLPLFHENAEIQTRADWEKNVSFPEEASNICDFYAGLEYALKNGLSSDLKIELKLLHEAPADSVFEPYFQMCMRTNPPDFIIGPYYPDHIKQVSEFSKTHKIPFISPWVTHNKFLHENPIALKFITSQQTMAENLARYIADSLVPQKIKPVCFHASIKDQKEISYVRLFKQAFLQKNFSNGRRDSLPVVRTLSELKNFIQNNEKTIVITLSQNKVLMTDFITQLYLASQKKDVQLCGLRSLIEFENIDQDYLNFFKFTFPAFSQMEFTNDSLFRETYKTMMNTYPGDYARFGKSLGNFLVTQLKEKGLNFLFEPSINRNDDFTNLKFIRPDFNTGLDNVGCFIYQVNNYQFRRTGWK
jgi:LysM repeat protein